MPLHPHFLWTDFFSKNRSDKGSLIEVLKENILFSTLNPKELQYLTHAVYERVYQPEEVIFQQNDRGYGMYLIAKGRVAIKSHASQEGENLVTILGKGSFFGELSLVDPDNIRTATAVAMTKTVLIGFFKPDLMEVLERKPEMGVKIMLSLASVLGRRLNETTEKISLLNQRSGLGHIHGDAL